MSEQFSRRCGRGSVGAAAAADVAYLSRSMFEGGAANPADVADLIAFDRLVAADAPEWAAFFAEAVSSYLLRQASPVDIVDVEKADWLMSELAPNGSLVESPRGLPLLLRVMEGARSVAPSLPAFALRQLRTAIITGEGPLAAGRVHFSRVVDAGDVALMRRILIAGGGGEGRPVSRAEADALFDIHDATIDATNDADFEPLFLRALMQHLRAASGHGVGSRRGALQAEISRNLLPGLDLLAAAGYRPDPASLVESVSLSPGSANWLAERILRDGRVSRATRALKTLLVTETVMLEDSLRALLDRAA
ncbi:hypothetical protein [Bosea sp. 117]|uniref:hypothetical protein n=1 Tax=Bosea sp. 117 TaxID=1125973 RepID=UPI0012DCD7E9|nr:hypothetical protein [Bosea sp. 117]